MVRLEATRGFGFLRDDHDGDWFFVASGVRGGLPALRLGLHVTFLHERTPNGPRATDIAAEPEA